MVTRTLFAGFLILLASQRLAELRLSRKNEQQLLKQGGIEHAPRQITWMKGLHAAWFASMLIEVFGYDRPFIPPLSLAALILLGAGQLLRYAAIRTLGPRWTVKVITVPGAAPVQQGVYRFLRHPNYLGVILEILAVPLLHSAYFTAIFFSLANDLLIGMRIKAEENALSVNNDYDEIFYNLPRFLPKIAR